MSWICICGVVISDSIDTGITCLLNVSVHVEIQNVLLLILNYALIVHLYQVPLPYYIIHCIEAVHYHYYHFRCYHHC